jgi:hypothetical protein
MTNEIINEQFSEIWAVIKDNVVVNIIHFEDESPIFIEALTEQIGADYIINCAGMLIYPNIGWRYDVSTQKFIPEEPKEIPLPPITDDIPADAAIRAQVAAATKIVAPQKGDTA